MTVGTGLERPCTLPASAQATAGAGADEAVLRSGRRKVLRILVTCAIAASVVIAMTTLVGGFGGAWTAIRDMDLGWLALAVLSEVVAYGFLALHVRWVVRDVPDMRRAAPVRTALVLFGLGSVLPAAPLEGFAMAGAALRRRRVDRRRILLLFGFTQWFSVRGLLALAAFDVVVALALSHVPVPYQAPAIVGAALTIGLLAITSWLSTRRRCAEVVAALLLRIRYWRDCPAAHVRRARGAEWHTEAMRVAGRGMDRRILLGTCVAAWIAQGLCLYCTVHATGAEVGFDVLLLAYTVGILASMVPLLPAGVGIVETVTPLILHAYGVPLPAALAAVLSYRLFASVLPALAGALALVGLRVGVAAVADGGSAGDASGRGAWMPSRE
jgi:uncharacterized protein (TIRG00374 family)